MPRSAYTDQLESLREGVLAMGDLVLERYDMALEARDAADEELASRVVTGDREINEWYLSLERECIDLFALQQPVASDLRFVASSFKIVTDLERIGDLATNLAAEPATASPACPEVDTRAIGAEARDMVADALAAYGDDVAAACWDIAERDDDLDAACETAAGDVIECLVRSDPTAEGTDVAAAATGLLVVLRDIERVGDHAVNIAARTLYMVEHDDSLLF